MNNKATRTLRKIRRHYKRHKVIDGLNEATESVPSLRESIGLAAADEGKPLGLAAFLDFVERNLRLTLINCSQPPAVQQRLATILDEIKGHAQYVHGYAAAEHDHAQAADRDQNNTSMAVRISR